MKSVTFNGAREGNDLHCTAASQSPDHAAFAVTSDRPPIKQRTLFNLFINTVRMTVEKRRDDYRSALWRVVVGVMKHLGSGAGILLREKLQGSLIKHSRRSSQRLQIQSVLKRHFCSRSAKNKNKSRVDLLALIHSGAGQEGLFKVWGTRFNGPTDKVSSIYWK